MPVTKPDLTERQRRILRLVVEQYVTTGQPVGSKGLVERGDMDVSPSTVRNEFAALEALGLLTHPHTSAGRVPTERGYRLYAGSVLDRMEARPGAFPLDLTSVRREVDDALQATTEMLSRVTSLLELLRGSLDPRRPFVRVGAELEHPELSNVALVGAAYGLAYRSLGTVSLLGPVRMDYDKAIRSVHSAAAELSRFVEDVYDEH